MSADAAVEAHALTRRFGAFTAVDAISFSVAQGEVFGWGWNVKGQLGLDNQFADQLVPDSAVQTLTEPDPNLGDQQTYVPLPRVAAIAAGTVWQQVPTVHRSR